MNSESYKRILKILNDNFDFNPKIIHSDYEYVLDKAINGATFFKKKPIHLKCFFHFLKAIREKIKKYLQLKKG